jgi:LPS sulfotransferase NodH
MRTDLLLCATPRCGSNLVCSYLTNTGRLGQVAEFFNPRTVPGWLNGRLAIDAGPISVAAYLKILRRSRGNPHGRIGVKMLYDDFEHLAPLPPLATFCREAAVVVLRRRCKLSQSISYCIAQGTGQWQDGDPVRPEAIPRYDYGEICEAWQLIARQEACWDAYLKTRAEPVLEIVYEDFVADVAGHVRRILRHAGERAWRFRVRTDRRSQRTSLNDEWKRRFIRDHGAAPGSRSLVTYAGLSFTQ